MVLKKKFSRLVSLFIVFTLILTFQTSLIKTLAQVEHKEINELDEINQDSENFESEEKVELSETGNDEKLDIIQETNELNKELQVKSFEEQRVEGNMVDVSPIIFKDSNFKDIVWIRLGKTGEAGDIYPDDVKDLKTLAVNHKDIVDITGIEYFVGLEKLVIRNNQISGNLDLRTIKNLKILEADNNNISSINLDGLYLLEDVTLNSNKLSSINIKNFLNLKNLSLGFNNLSSLDLTGNISLFALGIEFNNFTFVDLTGAKNLKRIFAYNNKLTSMNMTGITNVEYLFITYNEFNSIDDVIGLGSNYAFFEPQKARIDSIKQKNTMDIPYEGGSVEFDIQGVWLVNNVEIMAFENDQPTEIKNSAIIPQNGGTISLNFPENKSNTTKKSYDIKVSTDFGNTWHSKTVNVKQEMAKLAPMITGDSYIELTEGYEATQSGEYNISGSDPITITPYSDHEQVTWNDSEQRWEIAQGLLSGSYTVRLEASNGTIPNSIFEYVINVKPIVINLTYKVLEDFPEYSGKGDLRARIDAPIELFSNLYMDNKEIDHSKYTVESGSTIITLKESFLHEIEMGSHQITVNFQNGSADLNLKINLKETNEDYELENNLENDITALESFEENKKIVKTGDANLAAILIATMVISGLGITIILIIKSHKDTN